MMPALSRSVLSTPACTTGGRLVAPDGRELPLRATTLRADACAGRARTVVEQRFANPFGDPLTVTYRLPLPADGAVSGFSFVLAGERIVGRIERRDTARAEFEEALAVGRSAALLEQERSSVFTQEVGNLPAGAELTIEIIVDHPLVWLPEGAWEWRFPTVVAPRYLGNEGRVSDADRVIVDVAQDAEGLVCLLEVTIRDALASGGKVTSPSHALVTHPTTDACCVGLAEEAGARLDRDVVVTWAVAAPVVSVALDVGRPSAEHPRAASAFGLLTLVPPNAVERPVPRDLIVLLDTSGSMRGEPLEQAKRVVGALIDSLGPSDRFELIEFGSEPRRFRSGATAATDQNRRAARGWLARLRAGGATEMREAIVAALDSLREGAQRQVLVVTDGLIGFEEEIVAEVLRRLPVGSRVHTLGIGSAVNRSLTGPLARAGRGSEQIAELGVDVAPLIGRLLARMHAPALVDVKVSGSALKALASHAVSDLMGGAPALIPLELEPAGGELVVSGTTADGAWEQRLSVPPAEVATGTGALPVLFVRERIEGLELLIAAGESRKAHEAEIETLGLAFEVSTRLTSWVAVTEGQTVDPTKPMRRLTQPQPLPHGMSVEGLGLRPACMAMPCVVTPSPAPLMVRLAAPAGGAPRGPRLSMAAASAPATPRSPAAGGPFGARGHKLGMLRRVAGVFARPPAAPTASGPSPRVPKDGMGPTVTLRGRIALDDGQELVVEAAIEQAFDWELPGWVELVLDDGTRIRCAVVRGRSTSSVQVSPGHTLRLTIERPSDLERAPVGVSAGEIWIDLTRRSALGSVEHGRP
ncbi:MAG: VWA domain-containing protein [Polyangiaceae bacterium]|nr:VWA domain-containing protein [Polyangiaceae bacterium]